VLGNLAECAPFVGDMLREEERAAIERHARDFLERRAPLLARRAREGRVREGHGDLRAEHVCLTPAIDIFDCVEFSERLRSVDVACEIAFLAMDLDRLGMPQLADVFVDAYVARTGDEELREVLPVYESYRAMVRGKVESLRSREPEVAAEDRRAADESARRHFRLAARYARGARAPEVVAVCGLSGTGKSTVARIVGELTGFAIVQSDVLRKDLAGVPRFAHPTGAGEASLYGVESTRRTHEALLRNARETLAGGRGVVLDATFRDPDLRRRVVGLAAEAGVPIVFLECRAPQDEVLRRLRDRAARNEEASDATEDVYRSQIREGASYDDVPPGAHRVIDTGQPSAAVARALEEIYA